ncbi:MAG: hypothetical protein ACI9P7_000586 [Candidatus Azotimanducaceae bacterium]|jgi:hypothetical protein
MLKGIGFDRILPLVPFPSKNLWIITAPVS